MVIDTGSCPSTTTATTTMKLIILLVALVAVARGEIEQKIVGGTQAGKGAHPYICSLQQRSGTTWYHICGCVIWNNNYVVTAAHCLSAAATSYRIVAGEHSLSTADVDAEQIRTLTSYTNHPNYNGNAAGYPNDIAVMRLSSALTFNTWVAAGTFTNSGTSIAGSRCILSGWGRLTGGGSLPDILMRVEMGKITNSACTSAWSGISGATINSGHACFFESGKSACSGDSGGPVRCGNTVIGVTSWGISTCSGAYPSVYTRVSSFYSWVASIAGSNA